MQQNLPKIEETLQKPLPGKLLQITYCKDSVCIPLPLQIPVYCKPCISPYVLERNNLESKCRNYIQTRLGVKLKPDLSTHNMLLMMNEKFGLDTYHMWKILHDLNQSIHSYKNDKLKLNEEAEHYNKSINLYFDGLPLK
jgi:hypothetical protein